MAQQEKQLRQITLAPDLSKVTIKFIQLNQLEASDEGEVEDDEAMAANEYTVVGSFAPHKDLIDAMKKVRKHGLAWLGIELADEAKALKNWSTTRITLAGDHTMKKSRVKIQLGLNVEQTGFVAHIETGQITIYPKTEDKAKYWDTDKLAKEVDKIIDECGEYLGFLLFNSIDLALNRLGT